MNGVLIVLHGVTITPWKLIGYAGVFLFAGRWFIQLAASKMNGKVVMPTTFWMVTLSSAKRILRLMKTPSKRYAGYRSTASSGPSNRFFNEI